MVASLLCTAMDDGNRRVVESEASQDQDNDQIKTSQN